MTNADLSADDLIRVLGLEPLPREGGFFRRTYRSAADLPADRAATPGTRPLATAIYYLLTPERWSAIHRLAGDELYHFYRGDPVELLLLGPAGAGRLVTLGTGLIAGERPQVIVPGGWWQGSRLRPGGRYALLGTTMSPGYDDADYTHGDPDVLAAAYPAWTEAIRRLTPTDC